MKILCKSVFILLNMDNQEDINWVNIPKPLIESITYLLNTDKTLRLSIDSIKRSIIQQEEVIIKEREANDKKL